VPTDGTWATLGLGEAPFNEIFNVAQVFTPEDTAVITPNSDTPYSTVAFGWLWMDLRAEPVVVTLPAVEEDRYYSVQLVDLYTHNFAYLGTRCTGNRGGSFMITGPGWTDGGYSGASAPLKVDRSIACETPFALAVVRTQLKGPDDLDRVKEIQKGYKVATLSQALGKPSPSPAKPVAWPKTDKAMIMTTQMFEILDFLLSLLPLHGSEMVLRQRLLKLGLGTGSFQLKTSSPELQSALELGMKDGWVIEKGFAQGRMTSGDLFGTREFLKNEYIRRFGGAKLGIYGNSREEAMYPLYKTLDGEVLDASKCSYQMVLSKEDQQIAKSFWSLTMYDGKTQLLSENPLKRYLLNSPMLSSMKTAEDRNHRRDETETSDGSVTLHISAQSPGPGEESNWLPAPKGPFYLVLRLYLPKAPGATKVRARRRVPPSAQLASRFRTIDSDYVR
ncbi:Uncharacterized protein SCF082_LOCUS2038, partial [Durusdinium trenchii]